MVEELRPHMHVPNDTLEDAARRKLEMESDLQHDDRCEIQVFGS
jgi:hypothetical protein